MKHLKQLALPFTLLCVLSVTAFAGETDTPPCAPGQTESPPCASQSGTDSSTYPGQLEAPPASDTVDIVDIAEAVLWSLSLF